MLHSFLDSICYQDTLALSDTVSLNKTCQTWVRKHDILFFRLQSKEDRSFDNVEWMVDIEYDGTFREDDYGRDSSSYSSYKDFILTGQSHFQAPKNGTVRLIGTLTGDLGDNDGRLYITHGSYTDSVDILLTHITVCQ